MLACFCDLRFAAAGAKLTTSHGRLGLPAEFGLSWLLPRLVGVTRAADLLLSSRVVLAEEAYELGLVNRVVAPSDLRDVVRSYATELATTVAPSSLAATKRQLYLDLHRSLVESVDDAVRAAHDDDGVGRVRRGRRSPPRAASAVVLGASSGPRRAPRC